MTWLLRALLLVIVFLLIQKAISYLLGGWTSLGRKRPRAKTPPTGRAIEGRMVKDPQCGMYVASSLALSLEADGGRVYFCSENCRDAYQEARKLEEPSRS